MTTESIIESNSRTVRPNGIHPEAIELLNVIDPPSDQTPSVAASSPDGRDYHPLISRLGGRKFVLAIVAMASMLATTVFISYRYEPLTPDVIALVETTGKLVLGALGLFVGGNATKAAAEIFRGRARGPE